MQHAAVDHQEHHIFIWHVVWSITACKYSTSRSNSCAQSRASNSGAPAPPYTRSTAQNPGNTIDTNICVTPHVISKRVPHPRCATSKDVSSTSPTSANSCATQADFPSQSLMVTTSKFYHTCQCCPLEIPHVHHQKMFHACSRRRKRTACVVLPTLQAPKMLIHIEHLLFKWNGTPVPSSRKRFGW